MSRYPVLPLLCLLAASMGMLFLFLQTDEETSLRVGDPRVSPREGEIPPGTGGDGRNPEGAGRRPNSSSPDGSGPATGLPGKAPRDLPRGAVDAVTGQGPFRRSGAAKRVADGKRKMLRRWDRLPESLKGYWPRRPGRWHDAWGVERSPLERSENPKVDLERFWLREEERDPLHLTQSGTYEVETPDPVEVEPGVSTTLRGRIIDIDTGLGVPDAHLILFSTFYKRQIFYDHHLQEVAGTTTGGDGTFEITQINMDILHFGETGKAFLTVTREGYGSLVGWYLQIIIPGEENDLGDIPLQAGGLRVRGRVLNRGGEAVEGAMVTFTGEIFPSEYSKDQRYIFLPRFPHAITDGDGEFEVRGIRGRHWICIHVGPDCVFSELREFVGDEDPAPLEFRVLAGGAVAGMVVDHLDRPVSGAVIYGGDNTTHSYTDGSFRLENISGDIITLTVQHHLFRTVTVEDVRVGEEDRKLILRDPLPRVIFAVSRKDTGDPLTCVRITFGPAQAVLVGTDSPLYTNPKGRYAIVIPEGASHAVIEADQMETVQVPLGTVTEGDVIEVRLQAAN
ncbi:MAG: carboxypeptidase-like regulatory domain-containing protein [Planctomycetota bacterium]